MTTDPEHKFELALQLGDLKVAYQLAKEAEVGWLMMSYNCKSTIMYLAY